MLRKRLFHLLGGICSFLLIHPNHASASLHHAGGPVPAERTSSPADDPILTVIFIGETREYKSLSDYFSRTEQAAYVHLILDQGDYYDEEIFVRGDHLLIEGKGRVNLYCSTENENVMWVSGSHIVIRNLRMKHKSPGGPEFNNCTGRVLAFDNASDVTVEHCDLNGCGLSGLHDNVGNTRVLIRRNYIHDNSLGAYTDIDGNVWFTEVKDHPVFTFENNRMRNNGCPMTTWSHRTYPHQTWSGYKNSMLLNFVRATLEEWKDIPGTLEAQYTACFTTGDFHLVFQDTSGTIYDFGLGDNHYGNLRLFSGEEPNSEHLGGTFEIKWKWKKVQIPFIDGEDGPYWMYHPSITRIKPIKPKQAAQ